MRLQVVLFPEFTQVFADPCLPTALSVLKVYPSARAMARAKEGALYAILHAQKHAHYGHPTAKKLLSLASTSVSSGQAEAGRSVSLRLLCEQLEQTQKHLDWLQAELEHLLANDPAVKGLQQIPEFGTTTVAVLRAELGDVSRFARDSPGDCLRRLGYRDSKKVACGRARRSSPNAAAGCCDKCSIWRPCAAFTWKAPPSVPTIADW